jgi:D-xylose transport system substrate-binding protein
MKKKFFWITFFTAIFTAACVNAPSPTGNPSAANASANSNIAANAASGKIKIGFAMDTVREERWQRDRDLFDKHCKELEVQCVISVADNKADKQANDVDNLLTQSVDVLVIAPSNATQAAAMVEKAHKQGVPVISYDRLINSDALDLYISHQVPIIGKLQAEYALEKVPKGNYVMVYGDSNDNNALILKKAQAEVLKPAIERGDIKIVAEQSARGWSPDEALKIVENALTQNNDKVDVVIASNDGTAGGAISALKTKNLAGKVLVTGQDAQLDALQRIAEGSQAMTIYKPIQPLAYGAVEAAIKLAKKEPLETKDKIKSESMTKEVPAILLPLIVVEKDNLMQTVVKDGYHTADEIYKNIPADQRPKQ